MREAKLSCCRVKKGKVEKLRSWYRELENRSSEVQETLKHENMLTETAFIQEDEKGAQLYVYMESEDLEKAEKSGDKEKFDIDREHHEVLEECLKGNWEELETIGHLTNPDR